MSRMTNAIKVLVAADILMVVIGITLWLATKNANDFSGLVVAYPLIGFTIISICILIIQFSYALRVSFHSKGTYKPYWTVPFLIGIPILGFIYAQKGENREKLLVISIVLLLLGTTASMKLILNRK